jgi:hypothetical protein
LRFGTRDRSRGAASVHPKPDSIGRTTLAKASCYRH